MISVEDLADLLNGEMTNEAMNAIRELWDDDNDPFDLEHTDIAPVLEKVCEALNDKLGIKDFEIEED